MIVTQPILFEIDGQVRYYSNDNPVPDVCIKILGGITDSLLTDRKGSYNLILPFNQDYIFIPSKARYTNFDSETILAYDAALTLQAAVRMNKLDSLQQIAADADQDSTITAFDAALIARHVVGFEDSGSHVGEWVFSPGKKEFFNLDKDYFQQNFSAIIVGNVHGDWQYPGSSNLSKLTAKIDLPEATVENNRVKIRVVIEPGMNLLSLDFRLEYHSDQFKLIEIQKSAIASDFRLITYQQQDNLNLVLFGSQAITGGGDLITLLFNNKDESIGNADFKTEKYQINNQPPIQGTILISEAQTLNKPESFKLFQNYPNPFNHRTSIRLLVNKFSNVNLAIYNLRGEIIKKIINRNLVPGHYTFHWDGVDERNHPVGSGIYICRVVSGSEDKSFKLLFIK